MLIRFTMFPMEADLLPIYERLLASDERTAARVLRALLHRHDAPGMPSWFEEMPSKGFPSTRARTIRLNITAFDPALSSLRDPVEPLSGTERVTALKAVLLQLVKPKPAAPQPTLPMPVTETALALVPTTTFQLRSTEPEKPKLTEEEAEAIRLEKIANSAKSFY
jgi:hypothetical protein